MPSRHSEEQTGGPGEARRLSSVLPRSPMQYERELFIRTTIKKKDDITPWEFGG